MEKYVNFKKMEVVAANRKEAFAQTPFEYVNSADQAYKKFIAEQNGVVTEAALVSWMQSVLESRTKNRKGDALFITLSSAVLNTRKRPYTITNIKRAAGKTKYDKTYQWIDDKTGQVIVSVTTTKADAENAIKKEYTENGYNGDASLYLSKQPKGERQPLAKASYTPSKSAANGRWLVFGVEA